MKKITAIVLACIMLLSVFPTLGVSAVDTAAASSSQGQPDRAQAREELGRAIEKVQNEIPIGGAWTNESWKAYTESLSNADKIYSDDNATVEQLVNAADELLKAFDNLEPFHGDKAELWSLIEKLDEVFEKYDVESLPNYEELKYFATEARGVYYYAGSQEEIDECTAKLKAALDKIGESNPTDPTESVPDNTEPTETGACIPTESTTPTDTKTDRELLVERTKKPENQQPIYEIGEVIVGYKLYYQLDYNPPWEQKFDVRFGKYVFTQYLSGYEEALGLYIIGGGTVYSLSEAFCVKMTDIDTVVELIKSSKNVPFHFSVSVDENYEPDTTQPTTDGKSFEIADIYEIGELNDGYKLYYRNIPPPPWMMFFDVVYGKYTFTHCNGAGEENLGLYVQKDDEKMYLSEAFEKGITDVETAVALIKSKGGYNFHIINMDDVDAQLEKRYNGRKFNLVDLGSVYSTYRLYYNQPELICTWVLTFEYGGYTFTESGGQTGSMIPEDLGLYVVGNGEVYNLEEASDRFDMDKIVELINAKDINYTFKVEKTQEKTEPSPVQQPSTTPKKKTIKEKFLDYLYESYHTADYGLSRVDYAELGALSLHTKLIYGYHLKQPIDGSYITLGEYTIWSPATDNISGAGLYVYYDNGTFNRLEEVKGKYNVSDIVDLIKNAPAEHKFKVTSSTAAQLMEERYGNFFRDIVSLGEVADGYNLYYNIPNLVFDWILKFEFGDYIFDAYCGQSGSGASDELGLFIIGNGTVYSLGEAYKNEIVDIEKVVELVRANKLPYIFTITKKEPETTQPDTTTPTDPGTTAPTDPPTTCPSKPDNTPLGKYKQFLAKNQKDKNPDDFEVDVFKKLKSGLYLVHYAHQVSTCVIITRNIDRFYYVASGSGAEVQIYDANKEKAYSLSKAYNKGIITTKDLRTISKTLSKVEYVAKLYENIVVLKPGETYSDFEIRANNKSTRVKISNPKVINLVKDKNGDKQLVAKKKGTAKITVKPKNGKKYSFKVRVKKNPELANVKGKKISSVTVKEGGKVKVKIVGKVKGIDNIYRNTDYAKITSKKTAKTITVKGLKKGKTNLTIYVNGKSLSLKVKVK